MKNYKNIIVKGFLLVFCAGISLNYGCRKLAEVDAPVTSINSENVYAKDNTAAAVINNLYADLSGMSNVQSGSLSFQSSFFPALSADELVQSDNVISAKFSALYKNNLSVQVFGLSPWTECYQNIIYRANTALEGLQNSTTLSPSVKNQLLGDAYLMRSLAYFYLTNLYGDVPLVVSTDYKQNSVLTRATQQQVYAQIVADLKIAKSLLSEAYLGVDAKTNSAFRITPNKSTASAFLARVYLYTADWANAEAESSLVIEKSSTYNLESLNGVFLSSSKEAIWNLQPVESGWNTQDAKAFIIPSTGPDDSHPAYLSSQQLAAFESLDQRRINWVGEVNLSTGKLYYPNKYKSATFGNPVTEYKIVFRLAEQYLIRAEARAMQNNVSGAQADLNAIRTRAGLPSVFPSTPTALVSAVSHERQVELFTEWGDRWLNLKRTKTVDAVMTVVTAQKGGTWKSYQQLYPIPLTDIQKNNNLTQNQGY